MKGDSMLKFEITDDDPKVPVNIALHKMRDGSVKVTANGCALLWLETDGTIKMCTCNEEKLKPLGFQIEREHVKINENLNGI